MIVITIIQWILLCLIIIPFVTLIHETGHALSVIFLTKKGIARIYIGESSESNRENFRIGRVHFHLKLGLSGFCSYSADSEDFSRWKRVVFMICGPLTSLLLAFILFLIFQLTQPIDFIQELIEITTVFAFFQFLFTVIPMKYPAWLGGYSGTPSDGYQVVRILKEENAAS